MLDYVKSDTLNKYWDDNNIKLSDWQRTGLIINADIAIADKKSELLSILEISEDEKLKYEITRAMSEYNRLFTLFKEKNKDCVFAVSENFNSGMEYTTIFKNYEAAENYGLKLEDKYSITKHRLFSSVDEQSDWEDDNWCTHDGKCIFDCNHELMYFESTLEPIDDKVIDFCSRYIKIPHPFRKGDLVKYEENYGIVYGAPANEEEYELWLNSKSSEYYDISDMQLTSYFYDKKSRKIVHIHAKPWELEKINLQDREAQIFEQEVAKALCAMLAKDNTMGDL